MNNIIERTWKQGCMVGIEDLRGLTFQNEALAHTFKISGVDADGSAIVLTGTPAGVMLRADNMDVALTCALSDGCVTASLPAECYDVPGRAEITIYLTENGHKVCIYAAIVSVNRTSSGTASPGTAADVVDLVNLMQTSVDAAADSATAAAGSATSAAASAETASAAYNVNLLAPNFVQGNPYPAGQHVINDGGYYVLPEGHEEDVTWENTSKTQLTVGGEAADLKSALSAVSILENGLALLSGITQNESSVVKNIQYIEVKGNTSLVGWRLGIAVASSKNISFFDSSNNQIVASYSSGRKINIVDLADGTTVNVKYNWDNHTNDIANYYAQSHIEVANQSNLQINGFEALRVAKKAENILVDSKIENGDITWEKDKCISSTGELAPASGYYASNALAVIPNSRIHIYTSFAAGARCAFYDQEGAFISGSDISNIDAESPYIYDADANVPYNAYYLKISYCGYQSTVLRDDVYVCLVSTEIMSSLNGLRKDIYEHIELPWLMDENSCINYYTGVKTTASGWKATDYTKVVGNAKLYVKSSYCYANGIAFYDKDKNFIIGYGNSSTTSPYIIETVIDVPPEAKYFRMSWYYQTTLPIKEAYAKMNFFETLQRFGEQLSGKYISCWGDSLTAIGGWTTRLQTLSGIPVLNCGGSGEDVPTIMSKQGGDIILLNDITIPASGDVTIGTYSEPMHTQFGKVSKPIMLDGQYTFNPCELDGIIGSIAWTGSSATDTSGTWTFTRTDAGTAKTLSRPTALRSYSDITRNSPYLMIIYMGTNGSFEVSDYDELILQHKQMIAHANAENTIILGMTFSLVENPALYEQKMQDAFGRYFINLRAYLAHPIYTGGEITSCYGLADAGLTATSADITAIEQGKVPPQLLTDGTHYTDACKTVIGNYIYKCCCELGIF